MALAWRKLGIQKKQPCGLRPENTPFPLDRRCASMSEDMSAGRWIIVRVFLAFWLLPREVVHDANAVVERMS
jgi:hypothetical protein